MSPIGIDDDQLEVIRREAQAAAFHSEEARLDFERARRRRVVLCALGVCVLAGWSGLMVWVGRGTRPGAGKDVEHPEHGGAKLDIAPLGSPAAKLKVLCVLPGDTECHSAVVKLFTGAVEKRKQEIRVDFKDMNDFSEDELASQVGEFCAAIVINGKTTFEVQKGGKTKRIHLVGTVPTHYSLDDVVGALTSEYAAVYGDPGEALVDEEFVASCSDRPSSHTDAPGHEDEEDEEEEEEDEEIVLPTSGKLDLAPR